eukprot:TRINITY_DN2769_c0_g1_i1.p1 TRINITY_DN2769_c0_g1~~TRINITY_DN2769_c0_g1_i1.p1  ORF type:complete len:1526 (+),score=453.87 TRINITY_DN2769_c0_g1_i1:244-4821(+)
MDDFDEITALLNSLSTNFTEEVAKERARILTPSSSSHDPETDQDFSNIGIPAPKPPIDNGAEGNMLRSAPHPPVGADQSSGLHKITQDSSIDDDLAELLKPLSPRSARMIATTSANNSQASHTSSPSVRSGVGSNHSSSSLSGSLSGSQRNSMNEDLQKMLEEIPSFDEFMMKEGKQRRKSIYNVSNPAPPILVVSPKTLSKATANRPAEDDVMTSPLASSSSYGSQVSSAPPSLPPSATSSFSSTPSLPPSATSSFSSVDQRTYSHHSAISPRPSIEDNLIAENSFPLTAPTRPAPPPPPVAVQQPPQQQRPSPSSPPPSKKKELHTDEIEELMRDLSESHEEFTISNLPPPPPIPTALPPSVYSIPPPLPEEIEEIDSFPTEEPQFKPSSLYSSPAHSNPNPSPMGGVSANIQRLQENVIVHSPARSQPPSQQVHSVGATQPSPIRSVGSIESPPVRSSSRLPQIANPSTDVSPQVTPKYRPPQEIVRSASPPQPSTSPESHVDFYSMKATNHPMNHGIVRSTSSSASETPPQKMYQPPPSVAPATNQQDHRSMGNKTVSYSGGATQKTQNSEEWKEFVSNSTGKKYFFNTITRKTTWDLPPELQSQQQAPVGSSSTVGRATVAVDSSHNNNVNSKSYANTYQPVSSHAKERVSATSLLRSFELDPQRVNRDVRQPTEGLQQHILTMHLVDETKKKFIITDDFTIQDLVYLFADKLDLWQTEFFAVSSCNADGTDRWLHLQNTVSEERVTENSKLVMKIKIWKTPKKLIDPAAVHLLYLQVQQNIVKGIFPVPEKTLLKLAALQLQILYGDYVPSRQKPGFFDEKAIRSFLPVSLIESRPLDYLERRLFNIYSKMKGTQSSEGKLKYLSEAKQSPLYGSTPFEVSESGIQRKLAISEVGFHLSKKSDPSLATQNGETSPTFDFYSFREISGWNQTGSGIQIRISNPEKKPVFDFVTSSGLGISELLSELYILLSEQVTVPSVQVPLRVAPDVDVRFYEIPTNLENTNALDPNYSRLDLLKTYYLEECRLVGVEPLDSVLKQIDEHSDSDILLEGLNVSKRGLELKELEALFKAIPRAAKYPPKKGFTFVENMNFHSINLSNNRNLGPESASVIGSFLSETFVSIRTLNMGTIRLTHKGAVVLANYLERNDSITHLILNDNDLGDKGAICIIESIKNKKNYTTIDLANNGIQEEKTWSLLGELLRANDNFSGLNLAYNKVGDAGIKILLTALRRGTKTVQTLDVSSCQIAKGTKELMIWLGQNTQVKSFSMAKNAMSEKATIELVKLLNEGVHKVAKLDLKYCSISSKPLKEMCTNLHKLRHLEGLVLSGNHIKKKAALGLCESLNRLKNINSLSLRDCSLAKVSILELLKTLRKHSQLKVLDLAVNPEVSSSDVAKELEDFLTQNHVLEEINLANCDLSSQAFQNVVSGLAKSRSVKIFHLDANRLGKHVVKLAEALNKNLNIEEITLKNVDVSKKDVLDLFKVMNGDSLLRRMSLDRNELSRSDFEAVLRQYPALEITFDEK